MTHRLMACLFVAALSGLASEASGQMFVSTGRDTLRGLTGLEVIVESLDPAIEQRGLTGAAIREDVERQLRAGGIRVYASQAENDSPAKPYVYVHVNALELPRNSGFAVAIQVHVRQTLRSLVTESNVVNAMTWEVHNVVTVPAAGLAGVRQEIQRYIEQLVRDWSAVHSDGR